MKKPFLLLLFSLLLLAGPARAGEVWVAAKLKATGIDSGTVETFQELLMDEVRNRMKVTVRPARDGVPCGDPSCAQVIARDEGAAFVIYGSVTALGNDILIRVGVWDGGKGEVRASKKMTVNQVEDLAVAAERIAAALDSGKKVEDTAELGTVVEKEVPAARRKEGARGPALHVAGIAPLGMSYADADFGVHLQFSYWFETNDFVIEPRFGYAFSTNRDVDTGGVFSAGSMEIGGYYVFSRGNVAPILGLSVGARYGKEEAIITTQSPASVLQETTVEHEERRGWGFGGTVRAGLLLMRTYAMRMALFADYGIGYMDQIHTKLPQSITFGVSVMF